MLYDCHSQTLTRLKYSYAGIHSSGQMIFAERGLVGTEDEGYKN